MKKILAIAALAGGAWLAQVDTSEAIVCARGPYRAGCAGPYGGAAVRGPYGGYAARGPYGGAAVGGPRGGVVRGPYGGTAVYRRW
jgi:hypothetical protein